MDRIMSTFESLFLGTVMISCTSILFVNIVMRYIFHHPLYWTEELVRYSIIWMVLIGGSKVVKRTGHIAVDILPSFLPPKPKNILKNFVPLIAISFCGILFYFSWEHTMNVKDTGEITAAMEAPMWIMYLAFPAGALMMGIRWVQKFIHQLMVKEKELPSPKDKNKIGDD